MKKIYLQKVEQHDKICYIGKIDPRDLVRVATKVEMSTVQDAQRPLNEKRVKDIAKYVGEGGILPNTLTLATKDTIFDVKPLSDPHLFYIEFPESDDEFENFKEKIDVMDGQHRLYSFLNDMCILHQDEKFEIGFTLYIRPTLTARRQIFVSCNEKQEKVSGNLLMWFRAQLNMLSDEEKNFYNVVQKLSEEYPLKGHVKMNAEKIKNGVNAKEIMAAMKQAKIQDLEVNGRPLSDDEKVSLINLYLVAWEKFACFEFALSKPREAGAAVKMAGLKFMILLLPKIWERALSSQRKIDEDFIKDILSQIATSLGVDRESFFTSEVTKMNFRDRTAVDAFANQCNNIITNLVAQGFNPLA
jgi:DGQHR domain-containing protein